ncbi:MAG: metallopeptidase family protein [Elusimicrobia bacterium]|nr:metallopeptidase family protein [Elusimicrobiota bacterium]
MFISKARFESMADEAFEGIPEKYRELLYNVSIEVRGIPGPEAGKMNGSANLLGLYTGMTRAEMQSTGSGSYMPSRVILYQKNIQRDCKNEAELEAAVRTTLRHELAHHFGFTDEELKEKWPEGA